MNYETRRTLPLYLHFDEVLICAKCSKRMNREMAYLGCCKDKIIEVFCEHCWKTMSEWRKEQ